ncbi:unnamed protein product [Strongylus vulgaris]|uniref:Corticotropin-releasing factor domain-containing protein n=1 Tax=Strongylus vulgaris TaxID=40348 RepID=A0A3P7L007_STRVU|nr:unnamed protein product [Strongylus vulgaris]
MLNVTVGMKVLSQFVLVCVASMTLRSSTEYIYTFVPEYVAAQSLPEWQIPQNNLPFHSYITAPSPSSYGDATPPAQFVRAPLAYLPPGFQYSVYPRLQYYPPTSEDRKTITPYPSEQSRRLQTIPSDEELVSEEMTDDDPPAADSTLFYQELLRAQLYRQLQAIKKAYRLRKAFEKMKKEKPEM